MKVRGIFSFLVGAVLVQFARAKMPFTNDIFGKLEGTLDFCIQVDNSAAKKYDEKKKSLVKDVPEGEVAKARESDEYKSGYKWVGEELRKLQKNEALKACSTALESKT